jgi:hypothetical protein
MRRFHLSLTVLALSAALAAAPALAKGNSSGPNWEAQPLYTTLEIEPEFENDPRTVELEAGGERTIEGMGADCSGFVNWDAPDVDINYANNKEPGDPAGTEKLHIYVKADKDTTLLIYTPDRKWVCGDDISEANLNPLVTFDKPQAGNYNIWVGTYESGETQKATLYISELDSPK